MKVVTQLGWDVEVMLTLTSAEYQSNQFGGGE